ncbi:MAG TPA: sensor histidine kinase, partial [Jatrophihabitans sp.]|nr:sensor histidine kinase [Jatrophihabitans sp.]
AVSQPDDELFAWVVREGVTNVVRHSRARSCQVVLGPRSIEISDDGIGAMPGCLGNGLAGLRERVLAAGGRLELGPAAGSRGWRVLVELAAA